MGIIIFLNKMLAQTLSTDATPTPFNINSFISSLADDEGYLVNGDSAQFASGYLYAGSDQLVDKRDYIVGCTKHNDELATMGAEDAAFFNSKDWDKTLEKNYKENKDYVDQQWGFCIDRWNLGVYFDSGMF